MQNILEGHFNCFQYKLYVKYVQGGRQHTQPHIKDMKYKEKDED